MDDLPGRGSAGHPSAAEYVPATTDLAKLREQYTGQPLADADASAAPLATAVSMAK